MSTISLSLATSSVLSYHLPNRMLTAGSSAFVLSTTYLGLVKYAACNGFPSRHRSNLANSAYGYIAKKSANSSSFNPEAFTTFYYYSRMTKEKSS